MSNKYYTEKNTKKLNAKYVFVMPSRSMGKTLYMKQKLKEGILKNEERVLFTEKNK